MKATLFTAPVGVRLRVQQVYSHPDVSTRLREIGFCENAIVRCITRNENNLICEILNSRIGLNDVTANSIVVTPFE